MTKGIVLITGATGFIGSAMIRRLAADHRIVALDHASPPLVTVTSGN